MSLINVKDLTFSYDGSNEIIIQNVSFQIDTNWHLGFTGQLWRGNGLEISYVNQDTSGLQGKLGDLATRSGISESLFLAMLAKLDVPKNQMDKDMASLSAGQKNKVLLQGRFVSLPICTFGTSP